MTGVSFKNRWIYSIYAWRGRVGSTPFSLSDVLDPPGRLLICLPANRDEARKAVVVVPGLIACLEAETAFVVGEPSSIDYCDSDDKVIQTVPLDETSRRWSGLPSVELLSRLAGEHLNVAIDLNPRPELLPSILCLRINAPVRLCLGGPSRAHFFNVHIMLADERSAYDDDVEPGIPLDADRTDSSVAGVTAPSVSSPYERMLRVIQRLTGPSSDPRIST